MPVSNAASFAYIHVRKTAGTSISRALEAIAPDLTLNEKGLWDILSAHPQRRWILTTLRSCYPINSITAFPQWHLPAAIVRRIVGARRWNDLFTFAFVRNPWDLVVSAYHFEKRDILEPHMASSEPDRAEALRRCFDFERFVRIYPLLEPIDQTSMLVDEHDKVIVDFVGRFERLNEDFGEICARLGTPGEPLRHENRTPERAHYRSYYTTESRDIVARYFARDIGRFNYEY